MDEFQKNSKPTHSRLFIMSHIAFLLTFKSFFKLRFIYTIKIHRNDEQNHETKKMRKVNI